MPSDLPQRIIATLHQVVGAPRDGVPLHAPEFAGKEWDYVKSCLDTGWVSSAGRFVGAFEQELARSCGASEAIAVANGTAALHLALLGAGVQPGDEVIVPALTFVATANAVVHAGATPHFADCCSVTLGIDARKLADHLDRTSTRRSGSTVNRHTGRRIAAVVPMHVFGHPSDMAAIAEVARQFGLVVVEDAAESLGSLYKGRPTGSFGLTAALSFNGNKIVTTGGGGAVLTSDPDLARHIRHIATTAKRPHRWEFDHDAVAYDYRMPNLNAALGLAQLEQLEGFVEDKRNLAATYTDAFAHLPGVSTVREPPETRSNYWLNAILLHQDQAERRDEVLEAVNDAGYHVRPVWRLLHRLAMYRDMPRMDLAVAEDLERRLINLPSSAALGRRAACA